MSALVANVPTHSKKNEGELEPVVATEQDILWCQFQNWYPIFERNSIKSRIIKLPLEFIAYLQEDGIILPASVGGAGAADYLSDDEDLKDGSETEAATSWDFPDLNAELKSCLDAFEGGVFVKLNWSAPIDAAWMNCGSLKCYNIEQIYLLLKSSDRINFDIERMFEECSCGTTRKAPDQYNLVLRKWANLQPSMEFRMFVYKGSLVGISQRDCCTFYEFLYTEIPRISKILCAFFINVVSTGNIPLKSYALDVYVDKKSQVWLIDVNPFGNPSCALLFEWNEFPILKQEIESNAATTTTAFGIKTGAVDADTDAAFVEPASSMATPQPEFRYVRNKSEVLQSSAGTNRGPVDVHMSQDFPKFMEIAKKHSAMGDESSSDEEEVR